jgi:hypothetical protein
MTAGSQVAGLLERTLTNTFSEQEANDKVLPHDQMHGIP